MEILCRTVGELTDALKKYPADMELRDGFNSGLVVVHFNKGTENEHIGIEENDGLWVDRDTGEPLQE